MNWNEIKAEAANYHSKSNILDLPVNCVNDWYGIAFIGCQHLGSVGTDYTKAENDALMIRHTENCGAIFCGDVYDNFIVPKLIQAAIQAKTTPAEQLGLLDEYFNFFGDGKILGIVSGNHELWTTKNCGIDVLEWKCLERNLFYNSSQILTNLDFGSINYKIKVRHSYKYNSSLNMTNSVKRMWDMGGQPFDVGALAHHHESGLEMFFKHELERWAVRVGTYKLYDSYAAGLGYPTPKPYMPMVLFNTKQRDMIGCKDIEIGIKQLRALNV